jgi:hypothetical protein
MGGSLWPVSEASGEQTADLSTRYLIPSTEFSSRSVVGDLDYDYSAALVRLQR